MNELKYKKAFTLVELIIVITILVILATIAFVSFQNYTKDSRDANRLTTINNISKGLDIFHIKTGFYPEPDSKTSFTGAGNKKLHQGIISDNITNTINLSEIPFDPKEKTNYIYSTYSDGKYYQIASEAENITSFLYNTTYAENKSSIVKGNYKFDPSLPSLIVIPNSLTGSSIFDPKVCFVTNGGLNSITSNSGSCFKKEDMSLNTIDNSLIGYWDMESLTTDGKLKDLSGNDNHGVFSGTVLPTLTGGLLGKSLNYLGLGTIHINDIGGANFKNKITNNLTVSTIFKSSSNSNYNKKVLSLTSAGGFNLAFNQNYDFNFDCSLNGNINNFCVIIGRGENPTYTTLPIDYKGFYNKYINIILRFNNGKIDLFVNGEKRSSKNTSISEIKYSNLNTPLCIGSESLNDINNCFSEYFEGIIDDVKIYNRALSDQEIAQQARIAGF